MTTKKTQLCPIQITLKTIGGKWKPVILFQLQGKILRFNELSRQIFGINQKMLTTQLREMEIDGIIKRKVYAEVPPRVEYSITKYGESLKPILMSMCDWGLKHKNRK